MGVLQDKAAIVAGWCGGRESVGGIALALAKEGAAVAVTGRTESKLLETVSMIEATGGRALPIVCDVSRADDITRTAEGASVAFGGIDILVNNAYDGVLGPLLSSDDEGFMRGIIAGPLATFRFMRACHPLHESPGRVGTSSTLRPRPRYVGMPATTVPTLLQNKVFEH